MKSFSKSPFTKWVLIPLGIVVAVAVGFVFYQMIQGTSPRTRRLITWLRYPTNNQEWSLTALSRCMESTPFIFPTDGYIGYLWNDSFRPGHSHQGIDIFTGKSTGETPVYASYDGYLSRLPDWKSSLIIRVPKDPLHLHQQIWLYYTHLADPDGNSYIVPEFPAGSSEIFVKEGTLLGFQGNFSGTIGKPVGTHLHFSIVMDDGQGSFLNELKIQNTMDPSPYFDLPLNGKTNRGQIPVCLDR
ncbi:MAG: M23 family metallopeptidase [Anaerolineales bacterium]|nr:M23 family metallopeptidase [Anaerolineales bacterium]